MEHIEALQNIRILLLSGAISYDKAKKLSALHLNAFNTKAKEIAKKHNVNPKLISFAGFMR